MKEGRKYIKLLKDFFEIDDKNIYAVGKKAQRVLDLSKDNYIRHPSYGGASKCKEKILKLKIEE